MALRMLHPELARVEAEWDSTRVLEDLLRHGRFRAALRRQIEPQPAHEVGEDDAGPCRHELVVPARGDDRAAQLEGCAVGCDEVVEVRGP